MALALLFGFIFSTARAAEFQVPQLTGPVVDQAGMFNSATAEALDRFLRQLHERTGTQLQIATVPDLGGLSIEEASIKITDKWKLGKKKEDRGLLLLFALNDRKVRIEVGQGLEGVVPDVVANRIIREVIVPRMREGSADRAVIDGVMAIVHYTDPEFAADDVPVRSHRHRSSGIPLIFWLLFFGLFWILPMFSRRRRGGFYYWGGGGGWGSGGFGGGSSGGSWGGDGGGFSGGGSSGSW